MANVRSIFTSMSSRFIPGKAARAASYYFSVGDEKWTVLLSPDRCEVKEGKAVENADCVLKCDPDLFENMVLKGKMPGAFDIARGKIKTNDPARLQELMACFKPA